MISNTKHSEIEKLVQKITKFRDDRDWKQFHNAKDLALSLVLESTEVLEHFQWKTGDQIKEHIVENKNEIAKELADVFYWVLLMSYDLDIDIVKSLELKIKENGKKYPVQKAKGVATKYNKL